MAYDNYEQESPSAMERTDFSSKPGVKSQVNGLFLK